MYTIPSFLHTIVLLFKNIRVRIAIDRIHRLRNGENERLGNDRVDQFFIRPIFYSPG